MNIAIIGSGPAGCIVASTLIKKGFSVTIFEELNEFGGMLAYGIPEFRLPLKCVREKMNTLREQGVIFKNERVNLFKDLLKKNGGDFDFVLLAIGYGKCKRLGLVGEQKRGVIDALDFLLEHKLNKKELVSPRDRVCVIGGGNSAMDSALLSKRIGAKTEIFYRRTKMEMPALESELKKVEEEDIKINFLMNPIEFLGGDELKSIVFELLKLGEIDSSNRPTPISTGEKIEVGFDKCIVAVGQKLDFLSLESQGIKCNSRGIIIDNNFMTSVENIFAVGDCVYGPKTIADAIEHGLLFLEKMLANFGGKLNG